MDILAICRVDGRQAGWGDWPNLSLAGGRENKCMGELTVQLILSTLRAGITRQQIGYTADLCSTSWEVALQTEVAM